MPMAGGQVSVAVLGAAGTIAPAIVHDLAQSDEVASMTLTASCSRCGR